MLGDVVCLTVCVSVHLKGFGLGLGQDCVQTNLLTKLGSLFFMNQGLHMEGTVVS